MGHKIAIAMATLTLALASRAAPAMQVRDVSPLESINWVIVSALAANWLLPLQVSSPR